MCVCVCVYVCVNIQLEFGEDTHGKGQIGQSRPLWSSCISGF